MEEKKNTIKKENLTANILFSGVGFQERGLQNTGLFNLQVLNTSEINKEAILSYAAIHCGLTPELVETYDEYPSVDEMIKELEDKNIGYQPPSDEKPEGKLFNWKKYKKNNENFIKKYWLAVHLSNNQGDISRIKSLPYADLWTVSFPCFEKGTLVFTKNGYKRIEDIKEGEYVLTHNRRYQKVISTMNKYAKNTYIIKNNLSDPIRCTENHPFYARKKENGILQNPQWIPAKELKEGDFIGCPVDIDGLKGEYESVSEKDIVKLSKEDAYMKSFHLMQASHCGYKTVDAAMNVNQEDRYYQIKKLNKNEYVYEDGFVWAGITEIFMHHYDDTVFNLEVEEDNSYVVENVTVHNCQSISVAGKMKGFAPDSGTRSSLLWENIRLLKDACDRGDAPKYIMFENVKNLVSNTFINDFETLLDVLNDLGYNSYWDILNAKNCGIPQNRERVFVISIRKDLDDGLFTFPIPFDNGLRLKDVLQQDVDEKYYLNSRRSQDLINKLIMDGKIGNEEQGNV